MMMLELLGTQFDIIDMKDNVCCREHNLQVPQVDEEVNHDCPKCAI